MAYSVMWYVENRVIQIELSGRITLEDVYASGDEINAMILAGKAPVHVINIIHDVSAWPDVSDMFRAFYRGPERGLTIVVGTLNPVFSFIVRIINDVLKLNMYMFPTMESGWVFLCEHDPTLADSSPLISAASPAQSTNPDQNLPFS